MRKLNLFKSGLTALMMAFAVTLSFSCSKDDDEEVPSDNAHLSSLHYVVWLTGRDFSESIVIYKGDKYTMPSTLILDSQTNIVNVGDTLSLSVKPLYLTAQPKSVDAWDDLDMISFDKETNKVIIVKKNDDGKTSLTVKITDPSGESVQGIFDLKVLENY